MVLTMSKFIIKNREVGWGGANPYRPKGQFVYSAWKTQVSYGTQAEAEGDFDNREVGLSQCAIFHQGKIIARKP